MKSRSRLRKFEKSLRKTNNNKASSFSSAINLDSSHTMYPNTTYPNSEIEKGDCGAYNSCISEKSKSRVKSVKPDISTKTFVHDK
jgi:hypothetical protein